jgi:mutator protein MutT
MTPQELLKFCPRCGREQIASAKNPFQCPFCGHTQFFNPAAAVAAILLRPDGCALFLRRARDPGKGKLGLPGGFVDIGETAENALRREIREEVNLEVAELEFLCTLTNEYHYKGITYPVLDLFFVTHAAPILEAAALDGVESFAWIDPRDVNLSEMAFGSNAEALRRFNARG